MRYRHYPYEYEEMFSRTTRQRGIFSHIAEARALAHTIGTGRFKGDDDPEAIRRLQIVLIYYWDKLTTWDFPRASLMSKLLYEDIDNINILLYNKRWDWRESKWLLYDIKKKKGEI